MADQRPWSDHEKLDLLAEIIKTSSPTPGVLFNVVAQQNIQPRWEDTPLPRGRSLNQCRAAFEEMRRQHPAAFLSGHPAPQTPLTAPLYSKRPFSLEPVYPGGREIRPKPYPSASVTSLPSGEPTQKRKRGRPTKAQAQAKAAAAEGVAPPGPSGTAVIAPQGVH
ncbi:hypothetical protein EJ03DRAFT_200362 [Teratosphaeria nubilosa]|uniref:Uncharacterized protein n=1 Tax=Teratosphaeria nubilosa TaxID=161662 RepID=A0A6G1LH89_9PEZI|nr:hypothetical protein EJ03DRAFT_200362 [Teratosphaeria nubilosa]